MLCSNKLPAACVPHMLEKSTSPVMTLPRRNISHYSVLVMLCSNKLLAVRVPLMLEKRTSPAITLPRRNISRYKTQTQQSMQSLSPIMCDDVVSGVNHSPIQAQRRFCDRLIRSPVL